MSLVTGNQDESGVTIFNSKWHKMSSEKKKDFLHHKTWEGDNESQPQVDIKITGMVMYSEKAVDIYLKLQWLVQFQHSQKVFLLLV